MTRSRRHLSRTATLVLALGLGMVCGAQQLPVALTLHLTGRAGAPLANATIGIAFAQDAPFFHYRSDASGNVTLALAPGAHDLRIQARGYPVAGEHVDVSAPTTLNVALDKAATKAPKENQPAAPRAAPAAKATAPAKSTSASRKKAASAPPASVSANPLQAWSSCFFPDGLATQSATPLAQEGGSRVVETSLGQQHIDIAAAEQVMFAYPFTDFFAKVNVEELPAASWAQEKQSLLANLTYLVGQPGGPDEAHSLPSNLHGFEVHGNNRQQLQGSVLGMYVIFDDPAHIVATVYFLNQDSWRRKFQSFDEYEQLRDRFLTTYTGCVHNNQAMPR